MTLAQIPALRGAAGREPGHGAHASLPTHGAALGKSYLPVPPSFSRPNKVASAQPAWSPEKGLPASPLPLRRPLGPPVLRLPLLSHEFHQTCAPLGLCTSQTFPFRFLKKEHLPHPLWSRFHNVKGVKCLVWLLGQPTAHGICKLCNRQRVRWVHSHASI